ncbi:MAG: hypothetical protein P1Q69_01360 [Candidatus Thorarchaeota archaeon]|nr:hypothetical protein [Candidatus Thorarchaeota archaeon]
MIELYHIFVSASCFHSYVITYLIPRPIQNMIEIYLYGQLKNKVEEKIPDATRIMVHEFVDGESFQDCLHRLGLNLNDVGDCYINGKLARPDDVICDLDSLELNQLKRS